MPLDQMQHGPEGQEELARMSFGDHLDELRKRLWRAVLAVFVAMLAMLPFHDEVLGIIIQPYRILWRQAFVDYCDDLVAKGELGELKHELQLRYLQNVKQHREPILNGEWDQFALAIPEQTGFRIPYELAAIGGLEDVWTYMFAALLFALAISSPVVIWQAWAFVAAGLYAKERKVFTRYFPMVAVLLSGGVLFGYFVAVPYGLGFLLRLMKAGLVTSMLTVSQYFSFMFALTTALAVVFQLPLVMLAIQRVGLVRHKTMRKHWRVIVLLIFVLSAVLTPPDPITQLIMAVPALLLYLLGLVLTGFAQHREVAFETPASEPAQAPKP